MFFAGSPGESGSLHASADGAAAALGAPNYLRVVASTAPRRARIVYFIYIYFIIC